MSRRASQLSNLKRYRLTEEDYELMLEVQEYACAICQEPEEKLREDGSEQPLSVDHDHQTGRIRGLLCASCNLGLGHFKDDPARISRAVEYLGGSIRD